MKKHLFLFGSFMASSLAISNNLFVISCEKNASSVTKGDQKEDEKSTETVEQKKQLN